MLLLVLITLVTLVLQIVEAANYANDNVVDDSVSLNSITPNQFYKICPRTQNNKPFGQPICGDGTDFCFFFSRPTQRKANNERILIELMGGGACWDSNTCNRMSQYLTFPEGLNNFLGLSCSEINAGLQKYGDKAINMLCAESIGATDFTSYNTVVIPYCTQDVHVGSNVMDYSSGNDNQDGRRLDEGQGYDVTTVRHMGAHNIMSTLRWVFRNFPSAKHVAITGCSAGGTGVPIVYDLVRKHYNNFGIRKVQINSIADSPVYLTPTYFLENALDHWNPWKILNRVGWNYNKYRYSEEYPTAAWDYILRKGVNRDRWGFVSHRSDPVSLTYFQYMSGNGGDNRRLDQDDYETQWYSELTSSLDMIQAKHKNVDTYWINDEGHCSFGLYYALQNDGFADWAGGIFQESAVTMAPRPAIGAFFVSLLVGFGLAIGVLFASREGGRSIALSLNDSNVEMPKVLRTFVRQSSIAWETADSLLSDQSMEQPKRWCGRLRSAVLALLVKLSGCPVTAGLAIVITVFFWTMIVTEGFAHPLNNPSLGPSAIGLSKYGINNPSLILYKKQWFRVLTANFLCSGVLTYLVTMLYLAYTVRSLENTLSSPLQIVWAMLLVALGVNLMYAWMLEGATCSSLAFVLGLQTCHLVLKWRRKLSNHYTFPIVFVVVVFLLCFLFPFNDQWMMLSSILFFGPITGLLGFKEKSLSVEKKECLERDMTNTDKVWEGYIGESMGQSASDADGNVAAKQEACDTLKRDGLIRDEPLHKYTWRKEIIYVYAVWFVLVVLGVRFSRPSELYMEPFYTGCHLYYSTDVANIASASGFYDGDRRLDEENVESMCAEFCVPHITSRFVQIGVNKLGIAVDRGQCQDVGYNEHVADKTFACMSYSLDVEIYYPSE